jgi:hypothetical protein
MAEGILYRCRARVRSLRGVGEEFEAWKQAHAEAMQARELEGWAEDCLAVHEDVNAIHAAILALFAEGKVSLAEGSEIMLRLFDTALSLFDTVLGDVASAERSGYEVVGADALRDARAEMGRTRQEFVRAWPTDAGLWKRAEEAIKAGQVRPLREARDELRRRRS